MIQWYAFTWEAFSTITAAALIAVSAYFVGRKQLQILDRQNSIADNQTKNDINLRIIEIKLKLLDRRSDCISRIEAVLSAFSQNVELSRDEKSELFDSIKQSSLIFPAGVISGLNEALSKILRLDVARRALNDFDRRADQAQRDKWIDRASTLENEIFDLLPIIRDSMIDHARIKDWKDESS